MATCLYYFQDGNGKLLNTAPAKTLTAAKTKAKKLAKAASHTRAWSPQPGVTVRGESGMVHLVERCKVAPPKRGPKQRQRGSCVFNPGGRASCDTDASRWRTETSSDKRKFDAVSMLQGARRRRARKKKSSKRR